jgi:hypothetical protein
MPKLNIYNEDDVLDWWIKHTDINEKKSLLKKLSGMINYYDTIFMINRNNEDNANNASSAAGAFGSADENNDEIMTKLVKLIHIKRIFEYYYMPFAKETFNEYLNEDYGLYDGPLPQVFDNKHTRKMLNTAIHYKDMSILNGGSKRKNKRTKTNKKSYKKRVHKKGTRKYLKNKS